MHPLQFFLLVGAALFLFVGVRLMRPRVGNPRWWWLGAVAARFYFIGFGVWIGCTALGLLRAPASEYVGLSFFITVFAVEAIDRRRRAGGLTAR